MPPMRLFVRLSVTVGAAEVERHLGLVFAVDFSPPQKLPASALLLFIFSKFATLVCRPIATA